MHAHAKSQAAILTKF